MANKVKHNKGLLNRIPKRQTVSMFAALNNLNSIAANEYVIFSSKRAREMLEAYVKRCEVFSV